MIEGKKWVTMGYQLLGQALFAYFLLYLLADWLSFSFELWSYALVISGGLLALLVTTYYRAYQLRLVIVPIFIIGLSFLTGLYWLLGIALAGAVVWRYQSLEVEPDYGNEHALLMATTILAFVELIFYQDLQLLAALILQYAVLLGGYNLSHYFEVSKEDRSKGKQNLPLYALAIPVTVLVLVLVLPGARTVLGFAWRIVSFVFLKGFMVLLSGLALIGLDVSKIRPQNNEEGNETNLFEEFNDMNNEQQEAGSYDPSVVNAIGNATHWGTIIGVIIAVVIALAVLYRFNKNRSSDELEAEDLSYQNVHWASDGTQSFHTGLAFSRSKADNAVRQQFQQFEKEAAKRGVGRHYNESISDWFSRIGVKANHTNLYQKVRYGNEELSPEEKEDFAREMDLLTQEVRRVAEDKD
ncbi:DUF4129 domain-containing protein [Halobacillus salinus]|uniref:DUF4129 domain-containing protein n=1 Tax=Halobacillus salinus TaxID=192814 RepID=UPI0009A90921|nr:DUF4129 domain-containing protein [Halobacillus salinus]